MKLTRLTACALFLSSALLMSGCEELADLLDNNDPGPSIRWTSRFLYEDNLTWASNRDLSSTQFGDLFVKYSDQGLMIIDIDVRSNGSLAPVYSMVWQSNPDDRAWREHRDLTSDEYNTLWTQYRDDGYRPLDVEAYLDGGNLRFAGIWIENVEGLSWSSRRNMTSSEYSTYFDEQSAAGRRPIDIEAYDTGAETQFAAIWYENVDSLAWTQLRNIDRDRYQQEVDDHAAAGFQLIDYESYEGADEQLYGAIWEKPADRPGYAIRTGRSELGYANLWRQYRDEGYRIVDFENSNTAGGDRYSGIWIENADRFRYDRKDAINATIDNYRTTNAIPGISVVIIQNGDVIYRRGFGDADETGPKFAHSGTVYGLASVSKVIGSTLAAKLEDEQQLRDGTNFSLDLSDPTSDYIANLPAHHTHQVDELISHLGCTPHYSTTPAVANQTTHYADATTAVASIWDVALVTGCTIGTTRSYSTPAFTYLAAAMEGATGRTINELMDEELFEPYGLGSMRVAWSSSTQPANYERAVPYASIGNPTTYTDNSWKVLGGGLESNALDLADFGWKTLNGDIVEATARDNRMWNFVGAGCVNRGGGTCRGGLGWELRIRNGRRIVEHGGSWTGANSMLRVYQDDALVIAVLTNMTGHSPSNLVETLAGQVLAP